MIRILLIEDEDTQITAMKDIADAYTISNHCEIEIDAIKNDSNIGNKLFENKYDCIVIDINWGDQNPEGGRNLIDKIINKKRIPLIVYAGNLAYVEDIDEQIGFKKFTRTTPFTSVLDEIIKIKALKLFDLIGYGGELDKKITEIFWNDLENSLKSINDIPEYEDSDALVRMLTTRIINKLNIDENCKQKYFEFYVYPAVSDDVHNGDIYTIDDENYLVIMPECQVLHHPDKAITTVHIEYVLAERKLSNVLIASEAKQQKAFNSEFSFESPAYHFLPPFGNKNLGLIEFGNVTTFPREKFARTNKLVSISPHYMKNIQSRFSQYYARQGQPDIDIEHLLNSLKVKQTN